MIEDDNSLSINMIAREVGIDRKTVLLILRKKLKLNKLTILEDYLCFLNCCKLLLWGSHYLK